MDLLDRLLKHDHWTTRELLILSAKLSDEQLDRPFDLGLKSVRLTLIHIVANTICWTHLMKGTDPHESAIGDDVGIESLSNIFERASAELYALARPLTDAGQLDQTFIDHLDNPPRRKSFGAGILHIATHNMHHRAQLLFMIRRLGVRDVPEGDALGWERQHVGGWAIA